MADADASLRIVIEAMSPGLIRFMGLRASGGAPTASDPAGCAETLLIGTPSMTYSGSFVLLIELPPRIRICIPAPGSPLFWMMSTPAARPCSIWSTLVLTPTFAEVARPTLTKCCRAVLHLVNVGLDAHVCRGRINGRDGAGNRFASLRAVTRND